MSFTRTSEGSLKDASGKIAYFSAGHFLRDIVEGDCCFICGADPDTVPFNDEHVIPDWVLRQHHLHGKYITLPGGSTLRYDQYKVPCCKSCNSQMGRVIEKPVAGLFSKGYKAVTDELKTRGPLLLFTWLNLIFLKTHLKDRSLLLDRDRRRESISISELYDWPNIHHVHCVTRTFYSGVSIDPKAVGSIFLWPAKTGTDLGDLDFGDYYPGQAIFVRLGETFALAVLNDACGVLTILQEDLRRLKGPLSPWQCRELLAHAAYANMLIEERPVFRTILDCQSRTLSITADLPATLKTKPFSKEQFGEIADSVVAPAILASNVSNKEEMRQQLRRGCTLLFDESGQFVGRPL